jgi:hypothetical protein
MAALTYTVVAIDVTRWGTLANIQTYLDASGTKQLAAALDPLTDNTIVNPQEAYRTD